MTLESKSILRSGALLFLSVLLLISMGCTLEEEPHSLYIPSTFYKSDYAVKTALSGIYRNFAATLSMGPDYRVEELTTDEEVVAGKIQGWWYNNEYQSLQKHTWDASHPYLLSAWNDYFNTVGQVNALIPALKKSPLPEADLKGPIAELRSLRAYAYFYLMDLFGNVPVFTKAKVNPNDLPTQNTRVEVFNFVVKELTEAAESLPSQNKVGNEYYGRLTKEADYALLAIVYLNAEIYTGTAQYNKAIEYADKVINSNAYHLADNYFDNFVYNNENSPETIFPAVESPNDPGGIGLPFLLKSLPGIEGGLFGLPFTPQNGFATRPSIKNLFEDTDVRKQIFFGPGPLIDPRNGDTVMVERVVPDGNSQLYKPGVSTEGPVPYTIIPLTGLSNQPMNAGILWMKWGIDPTANGRDQGNDFAFIRYAEVLLTKAEAEFRTGKTANALKLVNQIRERSNATSLTSLTLNDILGERGRELCFEMKRRTDLVRFGRFTAPWSFKPADDGEFRNLFPIPQNALDANPNLKQNPGYN